jgi:dienelactone hydrolase
MAACGGDGPVADDVASSSTDQPGQVVVERGVEYATFNGEPMTLDLYVPADPVGAPIVIEPWEAFAESIAQEGAFAVLSQTGIPDPEEVAGEEIPHLRDHGGHIRAQAERYACAILFARARAAELGSADPVVVAGGFSEGGGVAAHVALFGATLGQRWDEFAARVGGPSRQVECVIPDGSTRVDALVGGAGAYDLYVPVIEGLYGRTYVQQVDPELQQFLASAVGVDPTLKVRLVHGTADSAIPVTNSEEFEAVLADAGYDVQLTTFEGGHEDPPDQVSQEIFTQLLGL